MQNLVIGKAVASKNDLSKSQKEFNRLTKKIAELRQNLTELDAFGQRIQVRVAGEYQPLLNTHAELRADMIWLLDRKSSTDQFNKTELKKLSDLITNQAHELIEQHDRVELKPVFEKHSGESFDEMNDESDAAVADLMKGVLGNMFGVDFDDDADVSSPEKMQAYIEKQMAERAEQQEARAAERRSKKPKSAKQLEKEAKKEEEAAKTTKSVREVYLDLVKTFHPDREPEEAEKLRKTEIMQRVTAAYEANDLLALLQLQLDFERIDQAHLDSMAEDRLKYFNKVLRQQAAELAENYHDMLDGMSQSFTLNPWAEYSVFDLERLFEKDLKTLKKAIKQVKNDLAAFADSGILKGFLKGYRIQKAGRGEDLFDIFTADGRGF